MLSPQPNGFNDKIRETKPGFGKYLCSANLPLLGVNGSLNLKSARPQRIVGIMRLELIEKVVI